jgi:DNA-binding NtrC family response regulator
VLVTGETGCGKEEVARAIHAAGPRRDKPFVSVNCGGVVASIAESQFFGHEKGAFTGAIGSALGAFRTAAGGIVFLDEIGEMPLEIQPKLLQVLERREVSPVGAATSIPIDVQVIAATNRDLTVEVARGAFREDLFYRLNTAHVPVPSLRERPDEIPRLVAHFSAHFAEAYELPQWLPSEPELVMLVNHDWPGNVRQLAQTIQRLYIFGDEPQEVLAELVERHSRQAASCQDEATLSPAAAAAAPDEVFDLAELRRRAVRRAIAFTHGHFGRAARLLGVSANTMTKLVAEACPDLAVARRRRTAKPR